MSMFFLPSPRSLSLKAISIIFSKSLSLREYKFIICILDKRALLTSKYGFSVVAPIRLMTPLSTKGRRASCWLLLNLWISSIKTIVDTLSNFIESSALASTSRSSLRFDVTADSFTKFLLVVFAIISARVVLPTPGGP